MTQKDSEDRQAEPRYTIGRIMDLLEVDERKVREFLVDAGVDVDPTKNDPGEKIDYPDYRKLWISRANRPEGELLEQLLIEESDNWADGMFRR